MFVGEYGVEVLEYALEGMNVEYDHEVEMYAKVMCNPVTPVAVLLFRLGEYRMIAVAPIDMDMQETEVITHTNDWQDYLVKKYPMVTTDPDRLTGNIAVVSLIDFHRSQPVDEFFRGCQYLGRLPVKKMYDYLGEQDKEDSVALWLKQNRQHWKLIKDVKLPARSGVTAAEEILRRQNAAKNGMS